jgi:hypothetical protein
MKKTLFCLLLLPFALFSNCQDCLWYKVEDTQIDVVWKHIAVKDYEIALEVAENINLNQVSLSKYLEIELIRAFIFTKMKDMDAAKDTFHGIDKVVAAQLAD